MATAWRGWVVSAVLLTGLTGWVLAQPVEDQPDLGEVLPGRPDAPPDDSARLAEPYTSLSTGVSFRPPFGGIPQKKVADDEFIRYTSPDATWSFVARKLSLAEPVALTQDKPDAPRGVLESALEQLRRANPNLTVLRNDVTNLGRFDTGLIISRYTLGTQTWLNQQAIVQADPQLYYVLTYLTPGDREPDPNRPSVEEARAVATFQAVLDTVEILDRSRLKDDQDRRLYATRALYENWTDEKIASVLTPRQWLRILRDGKDVGYIYMVQEVDDRANRPGVKVGIRSRQRNLQGRRVDSESWMYSTSQLGNRYLRNETFSHLTVVQGDKGLETTTEIGSSDRIDKVVVVGGGFGEKPGAAMTGQYTLEAKYATPKGDLPPVKRDLPPFYLPQALAQLLPRLLPLDDAKAYLFASYVGETREVMLRYVNVGREKKVTLAGEAVRAIVIEDRLGLEGTVTRHLMSPEGQYLGSETVIEGDGKPVTVTVLPSNEATLLKIWKDADLTRPTEPATPASAEPPADMEPAPAQPAAAPAKPAAKPASGR